MEQIRARLREKRGVDYTEDQIRELASVKLDRFLDPRNVRSDLLEHYRKQRGASTDSESLAAARALRAGRRTPVRTRRRLPILPRRHRRHSARNPAPAAPRAEAVHQPGPDAGGRSRALGARGQHRPDVVAGADGESGEKPRARGARRPDLRSAEQPGRRDDQAGHRSEEPQDAGRIGRRPPRFRRAAVSRARGDRAVPDFRRRPARLRGRPTPRKLPAAPAAVAVAESLVPEKKRRRRRRGRRRSGNGAAVSGETADGAPGGGETANGGQPASVAGSGDTPAAADVEPETGTTREPGGEPAGDDTSES